MLTHPTHTTTPSPDHDLTVMIDFIQTAIATSPEAQQASIHILMKWWLQNSHHFTQNNTQ